MSDRPAYLVFDIETVADGRLVQRVRYPEEPGLEPAAAVAKYRAQLLESSGGKSDFVPHTFQVPVSVAVAKVAGDLSLMEITTIDRPRFRPQVIARRFWKGWSAYGRPTLVTFNGRFFDLPVMELSAYRYGIAVPEWFTMQGPGYTQPRNRFNSNAHLDLQDFLGNGGATHVPGGLNLCSQLVGGAGKLDTKGQMVQELWERGERERIDDYCMCDALDTYFVFLRSKLLLGELDPGREGELRAQARTVIDRAATSSLALQEYLRHLGSAPLVGDDDDSFLP